jgi:hypothetical protein
MACGNYLVVFYFYQDRSFIAAFTDVSALKISRIQNVWILMQNLETVYMSERPILISALYKLVE